MNSISNVDNVQVVQGNHTHVQQNNAPLVNHGAIINNQYANFLKGVYIPDALTEDILSHYLNAMVRQNWDLASKSINPLIKHEAFSHYDHDRKSFIGSNFMNFCWITEKNSEAKEWFLTLQKEDQNINELTAWNLLFQISERTEGYDKEKSRLKGLMLAHDNNPDIQAIGIISGNDEITEIAAENIKSWLDNDEEDRLDGKYLYPFMTFATYLLDNEQYFLAEKVVKVLHNKVNLGIISQLNLAFCQESIKIQKILKEDYFIQGLHVPIKSYKKISTSIAVLEKIVRSAQDNDFHFIHAIHTLASLYSILFNSEKAIELFLTMDRSKWTIESIINLLHSYQMAGSYSEIISFIESLTEREKNETYHFYALALINTGEWERANELNSEKIPEIELFNPFSKIPLPDIENFHYAAQIAMHRYKEGSNEEKRLSIEYLKSYTGMEKTCLLIQAQSLFFCNENKSAIDIFRKVFEDIGAGYGEAFTNFMHALGNEQARNELKNWYRKFDKDAPIERYLPLKMAQLNFIQVTQGPEQLLPAIEAVLTNIDDKDSLIFKTYWLKVYRQTKRSNTKYLGKIKIWGNRPNGSLISQLNYLSVISNNLEPKQVLGTWYELIHENPRNPDVLEQFLCIMLNYLMINNDFSWEKHYEVKDKSYVLFDDDSSLLIDNDYCESSRAPDLYSTEDEFASELLGKKIHDVVLFNGEKKVISDINTPYLWAYRYAQNELPKRRNSNAIRFMKIPDGEHENKFDNIYSILKKRAEDIKMLEGYVLNKHFPALTAMSLRGSPISGWLHLLSTECEPRICVTTTIEQTVLKKLSRMKCAVFDLSALSSLSFCTQEPNVIGELWHKVGVVPSCIREIYYEKERNQTETINESTLKWDLDSNALIHYENKGDSQKKWNDLCDKAYALVEQGEIIELDSIPALEPEEGDDRQVLLALDVSTKDTLISCYGYDDRFLVTDDPNLQAFSKRLGIVSVSTIQLMKYRLELGDLSKDIFSRHFIKLGTGFLVPDATPVQVIDWLIEQDFSGEIFEQVLNKLIPNPSNSGLNISLIITLIADNVINEKQKNAEYVSGYLIKKITTNGENIDEVIRFLRYAIKHSDKKIHHKLFSCILQLSTVKTPAGYSLSAAIEYLLEKNRS